VFDIIAVAGVMLIAACSGASIPGLPGASSAGPLPQCPNVTLLDDTDELTQFLPGQGRDLTDIMIEGQVEDFVGECEVDVQRDGTSLVEMEMQIQFRLTRGPALRTGVGEFAYFVAIVDTNDRIMTKEIFSVAAGFDGDNAVTATDQAYQRMELPPGTSADDFIIIVGFQLTDEQLRYNRQR